MRLADLPKRLTALEVSTGEEPVGRLAFERGSYAFSYLNDRDVVSLSMPYRNASFNSGVLHPIFEMNIPEGFVRREISERLQRYTDVNDMLFLALQGDRGVGRLRYHSALDVAVTDGESLDTLLSWKQGGSAFAYLLDKYLLGTSISGVQPKLLVPSEKGTLLQPDLIVKTGGAEYPHLAFNEFVCMSIAKACGLDVPEFWLSDNHELFIMRRFDVVGDRRLGMEDFAVLMKRQSTQKYQGSYEHCAKVIDIYMNSPEQKQPLFDYIALSCLLGNGDAHLKNFALIYDDPSDRGSVRLSPLYDVVCTQVYDELDGKLALSMNKSREFPTFAELCKFAKAMGLSNREARLKELGGIAAEFVANFDGWAVFPELKKALEQSIAHAMSQAATGVSSGKPRVKNRRSIPKA